MFVFRGVGKQTLALSLLLMRLPRAQGPAWLFLSSGCERSGESPDRTQMIAGLSPWISQDGGMRAKVAQQHCCYL